MVTKGSVYLVGLIVALLLGIPNFAPLTEKPTAAVRQTTVNEYINSVSVTSITRESGMPGRKFKTLLPETDREKIKKITSIINSGTDKRPATTEEKESLMYGRPTGIVINLRNGSLVKVWPIMLVDKRKTSTGMEIIGKGHAESFLFQVILNGMNNFYTIKSPTAVDYILNNYDDFL